jgi:citrate lyase beta subunit
MIRSVLCVPGHDAHKVERCREYGADQILFDLEDAVPQEYKQQALDNIIKTVRAGDAVRIHDLALVDRFPNEVAVWVPKVKSASYVLGLRLLCGGPLWALIESPSGVLSAQAIAGYVDGLAFGRWDFMAATGIANPDASLVNFAMAQVAMAAHAAGIPASDAPCYDLDGGSMMLYEVKRAKSYGYSSKGCVHPSQIPYCKELGPSTYEQSLMRQLAHADGVVQVGGMLAGPPMAKLSSKLCQ